MSLFRKPLARKVGLKVLVSGQPGTGKTIFALSFPKIYAIDSETGMALYEGRSFGKNLEGVLESQSFKELEKAMKEITKLSKMDSNALDTVVIDSETKFYQNIQEACMTVEENRALKNGRDLMDTNLSVRSWGKIKQISTKLQNMKIDLSARGINVVSVSQVEDLKEKQGDNFVKVGEKPSAQKGIEYDYDIHVRLFTEMEDGEMVYKGEILKDRTGKTKVKDIVINPSFELWSELETMKGETIDSNFQEDASNAIQQLENDELGKSEEEVELEKITEQIKTKASSNKELMNVVKSELAKINKKKLTELTLEELKVVYSKL